MKTIQRVLLVAASTAVFFGLAEVLYRAFGPPEHVPASGGRGAQYWRDADYREITPEEAMARGMIEVVEPAPRYRMNFVPGTELFLCYRDSRQPYLDQHGCVPFRVNSMAIREREELCGPKPPGQRRILCLGDSMTVGWGVRREDCWTRLAEDILRRGDDQVRTVNCGAAGTLFVDEYWWGLRERFHRLEPDAVVVTLCLNDLLRINGGMAHFDPGTVVPAPGELAWWEYSRILQDLTRASRMPSKLQLDPERDWVAELLAIPVQDERYKPLEQKVFWAGGGPREALREMRAWCAERGIAFGVTIWPLFQGLGPGEHYPFTGMHDLVRAFCEAENIPFLDLLPTFLGHETTSLWVSELDYHGDAGAHRLASVPIARFLRSLLGP